MRAQKRVGVQYSLLYVPVGGLYIMHLLLYTYVLRTTVSLLHARRPDLSFLVHQFCCTMKLFFCSNSTRYRIRIYYRFYLHFCPTAAMTITLLHVFAVRIEYPALLLRSTCLHLLSILLLLHSAELLVQRYKIEYSFIGTCFILVFAEASVDLKYRPKGDRSGDTIAKVITRLFTSSV